MRNIANSTKHLLLLFTNHGRRLGEGAKRLFGLKMSYLFVDYKTLTLCGVLVIKYVEFCKNIGILYS